MLRIFDHAPDPAADPASAPIAAAIGRTVRAGAILALSAAQAAFERRRQRRALLELDDRRLRDIGLTQADVGRERTKWMWER